MPTALDTALDALSRRALSRWELEKRLVVKGFSGEEIIAALSRLQEWGYIDDRRLTIEYCQIRSQRYPRLRLREELRQRGVDLRLVDEVLRETFSEEQELEQCGILAEKLWEQEKTKKSRELRLNTRVSEGDSDGNQPGRDGHETPDFTTMRERVGAKLLRRGYPLSVVVRALDNFCKSD